MTEHPEMTSSVSINSVSNTGDGVINIAGRDVIIQYSKTEFEELQSALEKAISKLRSDLTRAVRQAERPSVNLEPYRYLDYFKLEHKTVFFGRDAALAALLKQLEATGRLTLLHAPSGAGKTSLLRAGLVPALFTDGDLPVYIHRPGRPAESIKQALLPAAPHPEKVAALPLDTFLAWVGPYLDTMSGRRECLYIILDQFEEFFIHCTTLEQDDFISDLGRCCATSDLPARFLLAMRKDYFSDMAHFGQAIPDVFGSQYLLAALTRTEAAEAITCPLEKREITWEPGAVETLLDYLAHGEIETPHLQLICARLYAEAQEKGEKTIRVAGVNLEAIHARYLEDEMAALARPPYTPSQQALGWRLLKRLVTSQGTKQALPLESLYELAAPVEVKPVLAQLVNRRLLRSDTDPISGQVVVEVAHDTLARQILAHEAPDEIRRKAAQELVTRGLEDWEHYKTLMDSARLHVLDEYQDVISSLFAGVEVSQAWKQAALEFLLRSAVREGYGVAGWFFLAEQYGVIAEPLVLEGLKAENFRTRAATVSVLGKLGSQFISNLCEMLENDYPQVRMAAIAALEKLQPSGEWRAKLKYECYVPAGKFIMGAGQQAHKIDLDAFYIAKYPVTNAEYAYYRQDIQQPFDLPVGKEEHPVVEVSWYDARDYAAWAGMRLLTEAEWEKAASGGLPSPVQGEEQGVRVYPWGNTFDITNCNTKESGIGATTPVGQFSPQGDSPYGISDMAGNVWEWCSSKHKEYPYRAEDGREDMEGYDVRVLRGGAFDFDASYARCTSRLRSYPRFHDSRYSIRVGASVSFTMSSESLVNETPPPSRG